MEKEKVLRWHATDMFSRMLAKMYSVLNQDDVVELKSSACGIAEVIDTCIDGKRSEPQED